MMMMAIIYIIMIRFSTRMTEEEAVAILAVKTHNP